MTIRAMLLLALASLPVGTADAQARRGALSAGGVGRPALRPARSGGDSLDRARTDKPRVEAALVTRGAPRSVQLVAVPVPNVLPRDRTVRFSVRPTGGAAILGRRNGSVDLREDPDAAVLVTVGVQSTAIAGRSTVAEVTFTTPGMEPVVVPVDLEVTPRRGVSMMSSTQLVMARRGARVKIGVRVTNLGNAVDTVSLRVEGPAGWRIRVEGDGTLVLPIQSTTAATATVQVPNEAEGTTVLRVIASGAGGERARTTAAIEVPFNDPRQRAQLHAVPSISMTLEDARWENVGMGLLVNGPLYRGVGFDGRWSRTPAFGTPGLSRIGAFGGRPHAAFYAENWRIDLGDAGASLSELAGVNAYGRGASFWLRSGAWSGHSLFTRPTSFGAASGHRPLTYGAGVQRRFASFEVFSNATHLDNGTSADQLDALTLGAQSSGTPDNRLRGELAYRRFTAGQGVGVAGEADRRSARAELRLRLSHAPGGTEAFARGRNQLLGYGARSFTPWFRGSAGLAYSDDASSRSARTQNTARTHVTSSFTLPSGASLGTTLEAMTLNLRDSAGREFGGSSRGATVFASGRVSRFILSGSSMLSSDRRTSPLDTIAGAAEDERKVVLRGQVATQLRYGLLMGSLWSQQPLQRRSFLPAQTEMQLAMQDVRLPYLERYVTLGATVSRLSGLGLMAPVVTQRYDARARLPYDIRLALDVERNPLFITRKPWSTALRVERDFELPAIGNAGRGGVVFQDLNGNGLRDRGEPGLGGIIIRADGEMAVSGTDGRYRLPPVDRVAPQVDERSLPYGWLLAARQGSRRQDFAVVPMSSVEVLLQVDPSVRAASHNLANVGVIARDSADRVWLARVDSSGRAIFDALPPGFYRVTLDVARLSEPLLTRGDLPHFRTLPTRETLRLTIPLYPRPIRVWRPGATATDSAARRPAPVLTPQAPTAVVPAAPAPITASHAPVSAPIDRASPVIPPVTLIGGAARVRMIAAPVVEARTYWMASRRDQLLHASVVRQPRVLAHRVRRGEYLRAIATRYTRDERRWRDYVWAFNADAVLNPDLVLEGQLLMVYAPDDLADAGIPGRTGAPR